MTISMIVITIGIIIVMLKTISIITIVMMPDRSLMTLFRHSFGKETVGEGEEAFDYRITADYITGIR